MAVLALASATGCADVLGIGDVPTPADAASASPADASPLPADAAASLPADSSFDDRAPCTSVGGEACSPCIPDIACEPANPCHVGVTSCASGRTECVDTQANVGAGQACTTVRGGTCQSGSCQCPTGTSLCSAACVDLTSDADDCGACGHACHGGTCDAGVCQPLALVTHTALVTLRTVPMAIVTDGTQVYYSSDTYQMPGQHVVWSVPSGIGGSTPQQIVGSQPSLNNLALGPKGLYWSNYGTSESIALYSITNDGSLELWTLSGSPTPVVSSLQNPGNLVIAGGYGYFPSLGPYDGMGGTDRTNGYITRVDLSSGASQRVVTGIDMLIPVPDQVAVAGAYVYWLVGNPAYTTGVAPFLMRAAIADGVQEDIDRFAGDVTNGLAPVASDTAVYWLTSSSDLDASASTGSVFTLPVTAGLGTVATALATQQNSPDHLAIDATYAYWWTAPVDAGGIGAIMRAPLDASAPATHVADTGPLVYGIALDATSLYWTDTLDGVVQLAKPLD
jgi:hypothetical protein